MQRMLFPGCALAAALATQNVLAEVSIKPSTRCVGPRTCRQQSSSYNSKSARPATFGFMDSCIDIEGSNMQIRRNGTQPSGKGPAAYFTGNVRIDPLFEAPEPARVTSVP